MESGSRSSLCWADVAVQPQSCRADAELAARILLDQGQEHSIETPHGVLHVTLHGTRTTRRPAILTFHDVGLDSKSCFSPLFKFEEMQEIVKNFTLIHIDAPGQDEGAAAYPHRLPVSLHGHRSRDDPSCPAVFQLPYCNRSRCWSRSVHPLQVRACKP
ncbi:Protein NDRG2 [Larimichthys crocea]|uniref:Uncharacterized protein n=1 Tax=Larimichthys crocea TaxID=215358 RepID=A0ACD3Q719_LARCR|nr:Protein NDRG2 [Larimichthys crocea]